MSAAALVGLAVLAGSAALVVVAIGLALKHLVAPGERSPEHIKHRMLEWE